MFRSVDTRIPGEVERQVESIYRGLFSDGERAFVPRAFDWAQQCFSGHYDDYQAIDTHYHDLEHTLQGTLCLARLLYGRHVAGAEPEISRKMFELGLLAILFHDTGYLKRKSDREGTGAKYTPIHVDRSATFAKEFLSKQQYSDTDIAAIQNMIRCTGLNADLQSIPFQNETERILGFALGTADLLGQMAAKDYVDKLPVLYQEFAEATRYDNGDVSPLAVYSSADDLMRKTPSFWENYVVPRINGDFLRLFTFLKDPYPDGPNAYLQRIEDNLERLRQKLAAVVGK